MWSNSIEYLITLQIDRKTQFSHIVGFLIQPRYKRHMSDHLRFKDLCVLERPVRFVFLSCHFFYRAAKFCYILIKNSEEKCFL